MTELSLYSQSQHIAQTNVPAAAAAAVVARYTPAHSTDLELPSDEKIKALAAETEQAISLRMNPEKEKKKTEIIRLVADKNSAQYSEELPDRIIQIESITKDPFEPNFTKLSKAMRAPVDTPAILMRSPPRRLTAEEQRSWRIPPCVSKWKSTKGYTVGIEARANAPVEAVPVNDNFSSHNNLLRKLEIQATEDVRRRAEINRQKALEEEREREARLATIARETKQELSNFRAALRAQSREKKDSYKKSSRERLKHNRYSKDDTSRTIRHSRLKTNQSSRERLNGLHTSKKRETLSQRTESKKKSNNDRRFFTNKNNSKSSGVKSNTVLHETVKKPLYEQENRIDVDKHQRDIKANEDSENNKQSHIYMQTRHNETKFNEAHTLCLENNVRKSQDMGLNNLDKSSDNINIGTKKRNSSRDEHSTENRVKAAGSSREKRTSNKTHYSSSREKGLNKKRNIQTDSSREKRINNIRKTVGSSREKRINNIRKTVGSSREKQLTNTEDKHSGSSREKRINNNRKTVGSSREKRINNIRKTVGSSREKQLINTEDKHSGSSREKRIKNIRKNIGCSREKRINNNRKTVGSSREKQLTHTEDKHSGSSREKRINNNRKTVGSSRGKVINNIRTKFVGSSREKQITGVRSKHASTSREKYITTTQSHKANTSRENTNNKRNIISTSQIKHNICTNMGTTSRNKKNLSTRNDQTSANKENCISVSDEISDKYPLESGINDYSNNKHESRKKKSLCVKKEFTSRNKEKLDNTSVLQDLQGDNSSNDRKQNSIDSRQSVENKTFKEQQIYVKGIKKSKHVSDDDLSNKDDSTVISPEKYINTNYSLQKGIHNMSENVELSSSSLKSDSTCTEDHKSVKNKSNSNFINIVRSEDIDQIRNQSRTLTTEHKKANKIKRRLSNNSVSINHSTKSLKRSSRDKYIKSQSQSRKRIAGQKSSGCYSKLIVSQKSSQQNSINKYRCSYTKSFHRDSETSRDMTIDNRQTYSTLKPDEYVSLDARKGMYRVPSTSPRNIASETSKTLNPIKVESLQHTELEYIKVRSKSPSIKSTDRSSHNSWCENQSYKNRGNNSRQNYTTEYQNNKFIKKNDERGSSRTLVNQAKYMKQADTENKLVQEPNNDNVQDTDRQNFKYSGSKKILEINKHLGVNQETTQKYSTNHGQPHKRNMRHNSKIYSSSGYKNSNEYHEKKRVKCE